MKHSRYFSFLVLLLLIWLLGCTSTPVSQPASATPAEKSEPVATLTTVEIEALGPELIKATESGNAAEVSRLIEMGVDINTRDKMVGVTPLGIAAREGYTEIVTLLLDAGAEMNPTGNMSVFSPLMLAGIRGQTEVAQLLIEAGADIEAEYQDKRLLHLAAENGQLGIINLLIEKGADLYAPYPGNADAIPLMLAIESGQIEAVKLFIEAGVDLNYEDRYGDHSLNWAAFFDQAEIVELLLTYPVEINVVGYQNNTAMDFAQNQNNEAVISILKDAGALSREELNVEVAAPTEEIIPWEVILQADVGNPTIAVEFLNDTFGVAMGTSQDLYYTNNAGQTWPQVSDSAAFSRAGLDIVDKNLAWLAGAGGQMWVSTDGAQNWEAVTSISYSGHIEFISFVDDKIGWAATTELPHFWITTDGGQTWTKMPTPEGAGTTTAILLRTPSDGYLLDDTGTLYTTTDGGQSWSAQSLGLDEQNLTVFVLTPSAAIRFSDADHGLIVLSVKGEEKNEVLAFRTADGGQTWTQESVPASIGQLLLTHDGTILTVTDLINSNKVTVLRTTVPSLALSD